MREAVKQEAILASLGTRWVGRSVHVYEEVGSTNKTLAQLAAAGAPAGTMVIADYQSQGRGRRRRRWEAPPRSSLLFSLLFRPQWPSAQAPWLTMMAGLAVVVAIQAHTPLAVGLKWPNDVMVWDEGRPAAPVAQWCKAGGLLLETQSDGEQLQQAIVGIGLNVNIPREALPAAETPATSLLAAGGRALSRVPLLASILQHLESLYEEATAGHSPQPAWDARLLTRNRSVRVTSDDGVVEGIALGSDEWGRLLVRTAQGEVRRFAAGDVTLRAAGGVAR